MNENNLILIIFLLSIVFNAVGDGLKMQALRRREDFSTKFLNINYRPKKLLETLYHLFWALSILIFLFLLTIDKQLPFLDTIYYVSFYAGLRFSIFDFILNNVAGKHWLYLGDSSLIDRILSKVFSSATSLMFLYGIRGAIFMLSLFAIQHPEYFLR